MLHFSKALNVNQINSIRKDSDFIAKCLRKFGNEVFFGVDKGRIFGISGSCTKIKIYKDNQ